MAERRTFSAGALACVLVAYGQIAADGMVVGRGDPLLVRGPRELVLADAGFGRLAPGPAASRIGGDAT
jgi:hypothetical protein